MFNEQLTQQLAAERSGRRTPARSSSISPNAFPHDHRRRLTASAAPGRAAVKAGRKIIATDRPDLAAMQPPARSTSPTTHPARQHAVHLYNSQVLDIPATRFIAPGWRWNCLRAEDAARGANVTQEQVLAATDYVTPAVEIIDARIEQFDRHSKVMRKVFDTISDNAANAGIVVGAKRADRVRSICLGRRHPALQRRGRGNRSGRRRAGPPGHRIAWLANKLAPGVRVCRPGRSCWPAPSRARCRAGRRPVRADYGRWAVSNSVSSEDPP